MCVYVSEMLIGAARGVFRYISRLCPSEWISPLDA